MTSNPNEQRFDDALHRLASLLADGKIIRDVCLQECVEPIKIKREELRQIEEWLAVKRRLLANLGEQIKQRQSELAASQEWNGTKQQFVVRQLREALNPIAQYSGRGMGHAVTRALNRRIDDLLEISRLRLSNEKILEFSDILKQYRKRLADDLRSARIRLRKLETEESQRARFLVLVNACATTHGFPPVPAPELEADKIISNGAALPCRSGIYFLWDGPLVAYVGQSVSLNLRVAKGHHQLTPTDKISYLCVDNDDLFYHEAFYIGACRPWRNGRGTPIVPKSVKIGGSNGLLSDLQVDTCT